MYRASSCPSTWTTMLFVQNLSKCARYRTAGFCIVQCIGMKAWQVVRLVPECSGTSPTTCYMIHDRSQVVETLRGSDRDQPSKKRSASNNLLLSWKRLVPAVARLFCSSANEHEA